MAPNSMNSSLEPAGLIWALGGKRPHPYQDGQDLPGQEELVCVLPPAEPGLWAAAIRSFWSSAPSVSSLYLLSDSPCAHRSPGGPGAGVL